MASYEEHCADCVKELGAPFGEVHRWLDGLFAVMGAKHRSARHNKSGVEKVRAMYGDLAARAAEIHVMRDYGAKRVPGDLESQSWSVMGAPK